MTWSNYLLLSLSLCLSPIALSHTDCLQCSLLCDLYNTLPAHYYHSPINICTRTHTHISSSFIYSRNPDALSITPAHKQVTASWIERGSKICDFQGIFKNQFDMSLHGGNKPVDSNGLKRMNDFCEFIFSRSVKEDHVIVGGHSIWFRSFFRTFLPLAINHKGKTGKIVNCGVVAVKVLKMTTAEGNKYMVDPDSVRVLFGGFN